MTSPVLMPAGHAILAADLDQYETLTAVWTSYTPTLTASVNPTNYTATARYTKIGSTVVFQFQITAGGAFTAGTGTYSISLPVNASITLLPTSGAVRLFDSSTGNAIIGARVAVTAATTLGMQVTTTYAGSLTNVSSTVPWTWAASDIIDGFIIYEAA